MNQSKHNVSSCSDINNAQSMTAKPNRSTQQLVEQHLHGTLSSEIGKLDHDSIFERTFGNGSVHGMSGGCPSDQIVDSDESKIAGSCWNSSLVGCSLRSDAQHLASQLISQAKSICNEGAGNRNGNSIIHSMARVHGDAVSSPTCTTMSRGEKRLGELSDSSCSERRCRLTLDDQRLSSSDDLISTTEDGVRIEMQRRNKSNDLLSYEKIFTFDNYKHPSSLMMAKNNLAACESKGQKCFFIGAQENELNRKSGERNILEMTMATSQQVGEQGNGVECLGSLRHGFLAAYDRNGNWESSEFATNNKNSRTGGIDYNRQICKSVNSQRKRVSSCDDLDTVPSAKRKKFRPMKWPAYGHSTYMHEYNDDVRGMSASGTTDDITKLKGKAVNDCIDVGTFGNADTMPSISSGHNTTEGVDNLSPRSDTQRSAVLKDVGHPSTKLTALQAKLTENGNDKMISFLIEPRTARVSDCSPVQDIEIGGERKSIYQQSLVAGSTYDVANGLQCIQDRLNDLISEIITPDPTNIDS